jgi:hypothetical protein
VSASQVVSIVSDVELNFSYIGSNCTIESAFSAGFVARRCMALHGVAWLETHFPRESWPPGNCPRGSRTSRPRMGIDQDYLQILDDFR